MTRMPLAAAAGGRFEQHRIAERSAAARALGDAGKMSVPGVVATPASRTTRFARRLVAHESMTRGSGR